MLPQESQKYFEHIKKTIQFLTSSNCFYLEHISHLGLHCMGSKLRMQQSWKPRPGFVIGVTRYDDNDFESITLNKPKMQFKVKLRHTLTFFVVLMC